MQEISVSKVGLTTICPSQNLEVVSFKPGMADYYLGFVQNFRR